MNKITIIVPVYNAENTIERCLASFISNRDYIQEVILVNDRSTDNTFSKIDNFKKFFNIRIIDNAGKQGPGPGRKTGILAATTEWITFVDADDCLIPSSLRYVNEKLEENSNLILLHTQSIYYESGNFVKENVAYSDFSCGGNFYKREYLIKHNLFPHDELFMAEDEYFNFIVTKHIDYYNNQEMLRYWYDYPVYEVHHDIKVELSFSYRHWNDYLCKYHLLKSIYCVDFFKEDISVASELKEELYNSFIFGFYLFNGLKQDENSNLNEEEVFDCFYSFINYCKNTFNITAKDFISYYINHIEQITSLRKGASISIGFEIEKKYSFSKFVKILYNFKG